MRQVSFTLLMRKHAEKRRRYGNSTQYERNSRFGQLAGPPGRKAAGGTLPSAGLRLNASKPESAPGSDGTRLPRHWAEQG